jgi:hypothetical protein
MKKNSIIVTHFFGDGGNFLVNALSMSEHVGHADQRLSNKQERVEYFFKGTQLNNGNSCKDVSLFSSNFYSTGGNMKTDFTTLKEFSQGKTSRLRGFQDSKHYICKQHYPVWSVLNPDIPADKIHDMNIILKSTAKLFRDVSTKTNCFSILFVNPSIFTALRHYFINGFSMTCNKFPFIFEKGPKHFDCENVDVYEELNSVTIEEYQQFSKDKREEIERKYSMSYDKVLSLFNKNYNRLDEYHDLFLNNTSFLWDANWYLSEDDTANNIKKIYDILGFDDYDDVLIREMYQRWVGTLSLSVSKWKEYVNNENANLDKITAFNEALWDELKFQL